MSALSVLLLEPVITPELLVLLPVAFLGLVLLVLLSVPVLPVCCPCSCLHIGFHLGCLYPCLCPRLSPCWLSFCLLLCLHLYLCYPCLHLSPGWCCLLDLLVPAPDLVLPAPDLVVPAPDLVVPAPDFVVPAPLLALCLWPGCFIYLPAPGPCLCYLPFNSHLSLSLCSWTSICACY